LLDADVIIDLHRLNLWKSLTKNNKIHVSSIICREVYYYEETAGKRHVIDLSKEAGKSFVEISATTDHLFYIFNEIHTSPLASFFVESLRLICKMHIIVCK